MAGAFRPLGVEHDDDAADRPHRLCAVTRVERPTEHLIRFVADPENQIVPDLACRLPGRGVWVTASKAVVVEAVRKSAFAKSLKRPVNAGKDLPDRVEALLLARLINTLSLANKAGLLVSGFDKVAEAIEAGRAFALLHGSDAAPGGREKLDRKHTAIARARHQEPIILDLLTIAQISLAIGRGNVVHAALTHGGLSLRHLEEAERFQRFRASNPASEAATSPNI